MYSIEREVLPYYMNTVLTPCKVEVFYCIVAEDFWLYQRKRRQYNNHNMALMLIDILHDRKLVNDATYKRIICKNEYLY